MEPHEWRDIEPHVTGVRAIHSPRTGIVDWGLVASHYAGMAPPPRLNRFVLSPASSPRLSLNPTRLIMQMTFGTWGGTLCSTKTFFDSRRAIVVSFRSRAPLVRGTLASTQSHVQVLTAIA